MDAILVQEIHLHKGGPTHAHWLLPCQACPQLRSAAFPCCNTLKPTHPSLLLTQKVPPPDTCSMPLSLQHDVGLVGRSDEPSKKGEQQRPGPSLDMLQLPQLTPSQYSNSLAGTESPAPPKKIQRRTKQQQHLQEEKFPTCYQKTITNTTILFSSLPASRMR